MNDSTYYKSEVKKETILIMYLVFIAECYHEESIQYILNYSNKYLSI
jgi:hypothetical protein